MKTFPFFALSLAAFGSSVLYGQQISVEVPVLHQRTASRPSNFNWTFESSGGGSARVGQFACGSYWIAPAEGDSGVTLIALTGNPAWNDLLSCDADPLPESHGLLDGSNNYGSYTATEDVLSALPVTFTPSSDSCISLVGAMQRNEAETSNGGTRSIVGEVVDAYCVVTVMPTPPNENGSNMLRPNITGASKEFLTWDDFDLSRLPSHTFLPDNSTTGWKNARLRWAHSTEIFGGFAAEITPGNWTAFSEGGRAFRAHNLTHDYGSTMASAFNNDLLAFFATATMSEEKRAALAAMLSFGLDIYHARYNYGSAARKAWLSGAGQSPGKFMPTVFLASLLKDESKANELRKVAIYNHSEDEALQGPQELRQLTRGETGVVLWGDAVPFARDGNNLLETDRRYWANLYGSQCYDTALGTCNATTGKKTIADPYGYIDGPAEQPGSNYMSVTFGVFRSFAAIMILMPEVRDIVNSDAPIEYVDRLLRHGIWTAPDPVAPVAVVDQQDSDCNPYKFTPNCNEFMVTWGPNPEDVRFAIEDGTGRFTSMHGNPLPNMYNDGTRARDQWNSIIALYEGETYEDKSVPLGKLATPEILFEGGSAPKAHLMSSNTAAEIRYSLDGSEPTGSSPLYTGPFSISSGTVIRARAFKAEMNESDIEQRTFDPIDNSDGQAPSVPTGLQAGNPTATSVNLSWNAASDNVGVVGYYLYVNGSQTGQVQTTSAQVTGLSPDTLYSFTVSAYDANANESLQSSAVQVATTNLRTWGDETALESGEVNTGFGLGWLYLHPNTGWAWSYSISSWIYAPDPGPSAPGAWIYVPFVD
jgi:hypothetical protein